MRKVLKKSFKVVSLVAAIFIGSAFILLVALWFFPGFFINTPNLDRTKPYIEKMGLAWMSESKLLDAHSQSFFKKTLSINFKNTCFIYGEHHDKLCFKNVDAKIQLAACYVEGTQDPMKGITLLREVEKTDSNNVKLQLNFAFFSVKSQQWDKAIKRFEKVLQIDPLYIEAYLHLADAYEQQGDKNKTIEMLQKYASITDDAMAKQEVLKYINQLKK